MDPANVADFIRRTPLWTWAERCREAAIWDFAEGASEDPSMLRCSTADWRQNVASTMAEIMEGDWDEQIANNVPRTSRPATELDLFTALEALFESVPWPQVAAYLCEPLTETERQLAQAEADADTKDGDQ